MRAREKTYNVHLGQLRRKSCSEGLQMSPKVHKCFILNKNRRDMTTHQMPLHSGEPRAQHAPRGPDGCLLQRSQPHTPPVTNPRPTPHLTPPPPSYPSLRAPTITTTAGFMGLHFFLWTLKAGHLISTRFARPVCMGPRGTNWNKSILNPPPRNSQVPIVPFSFLDGL